MVVPLAVVGKSSILFEGVEHVVFKAISKVTERSVAAPLPEGTRRSAKASPRSLILWLVRLRTGTKRAFSYPARVDKVLCPLGLGLSLIESCPR